jgi:CDP-2,3-bis-(O-geranylgeranyl)-sn-glycerol synthase
VNDPDALSCGSFLLASFIPAGCLHTLWLKSSWSKYLAIPLDFGMTFRGRRIFGDNKMLRGFVMIVPAGAVSFLLLSKILEIPWPLSASQYAGLGALAGLGFMLGELPNSFMKRQLDIAPGQSPEGAAARVACFLIDHTDSIFGMLIALRSLVPVPWLTWVVVLGAGACVHTTFSIAMFYLSIKGRPL